MKLKNTAPRHVVLILGEQRWGLEFILSKLKAVPRDQIVCLTEYEGLDQKQIVVSRAKQLLGQEFQYAVVDFYSGFNPDAIAVVAGTVMGGGLLFFVAPDLTAWDSFDDPEYEKLVVQPYKREDIDGFYLRRLKGLLEQDADVQWVREGDSERVFELDLNAGPREDSGQGRLTEGQERAFSAIREVARGKHKKSLVISSDRGRGKSTLLGLAAAELIKEKQWNIVIVAPQLSSVTAVISHCCEGLSGQGIDGQGAESDGAIWKANQVTWRQGGLRFIAADELIKNTPKADMVFVDEAAALPTFLLTEILAAYKRVVFATTIHGYEGNGQGFRLRFCKVLDQQVPGWKTVVLDEPVRWGNADPLERFIFRSLLLDARPSEVERSENHDSGELQVGGLNTGTSQVNVASIDFDQCTTELLDREKLSANEAQLRELMGLLIIAHYRTSPGDLRGMLDCPNLRLYAVFFQKKIIAAAVIAEEGHLPDELIDPIWLGQRRLRGHILPQSLSQQLGFRNAPKLACARVVRIAVHPGLQGQTLGSSLLRVLSGELKEQGFDCIGASFAVTEQVLRFWNHNDFVTVRVGMSKEKSSGCHAGLVMRPLSADGLVMLQLAQERFLNQLPLAIEEYLKELSVGLVLALFSGAVDQGFGRVREHIYGVLDEQDSLDVEAFTCGNRNYETCLLALRKKVFLNIDGLKATSLLSELEKSIVVKKIIQALSWEEVVQFLSLSGKKSAHTLLRKAIKKLAH